MLRSSGLISRAVWSAKGGLRCSLRSASYATSDASSSSANPEEIAHFSRLAQRWWDDSPGSEFRLLHLMNLVRVQFVRDRLQALDQVEGTQWLSGKKILDVGCGGGLFSEVLARLGGKVTGVDASQQNIEVAKAHAAQDDRLQIDYMSTGVETLAETEAAGYDLVCAMEVIEHVNQPRDFLHTCASLVRPGGHLILSTIDRTMVSYFLTITMAEHILKLVEKGTHTHSKFVHPAELDAAIKSFEGWQDAVSETRGTAYLPWSGRWSLLSPGLPFGTRCNYFYGAQRPR